MCGNKSLTGMPHWPGGARDDEIWAVVAFIRQLPGMSAEQYADLAGVDEGRLIAGGRMNGDPVIGQSVFAADVDRAAIRAMLEADPSVKAGITAIEFREWEMQMGGLARPACCCSLSWCTSRVRVCKATTRAGLAGLLRADGVGRLPRWFSIAASRPPGRAP